MPGRPDQIEALVKGVESGNGGNVNIDDLRRAAGRVLSLIRKNTVLERE